MEVLEINRIPVFLLTVFLLCTFSDLSQNDNLEENYFKGRWVLLLHTITAKISSSLAALDANYVDNLE